MKRVIALLLLVFLAGCAAPNPHQAQQPLATARTFNAHKSTVWPVVLTEIGLNYPVRSSDAATGLLDTEMVSLPVGNWNISRAITRWILPPGGNPLSGCSALRVALNALVTETEPNKTHVAIRSRYEVLQGPLGSANGTWVGATSNGSLEQEILNRIADKLAKP